MHVVRADGSLGLITRWTIVPGVKMMYNLEVAQDHTFTVGDGQWVVHNCNIPASGPLRDLADKGYTMTDHFVKRWGQRASGLTAQDVIDFLQGPGHYKELGGQYWGVLNKIRGNTYKILYDMADGNRLVTIEDEAHGAIWNASKMMPAWTITGWSNPFP
jgi:hypothetical protein